MKNSWIQMNVTLHQTKIRETEANLDFQILPTKNQKEPVQFPHDVNLPINLKNGITLANSASLDGIHRNGTALFVCKRKTTGE